MMEQIDLRYEFFEVLIMALCQGVDVVYSITLFVDVDAPLGQEASCLRCLKDLIKIRLELFCLGAQFFAEGSILKVYLHSLQEIDQSLILRKYFESGSPAILLLEYFHDAFDYVYNISIMMMIGLLDFT